VVEEEKTTPRFRYAHQTRGGKKSRSVRPGTKVIIQAATVTKTSRRSGESGTGPHPQGEEGYAWVVCRTFMGGAGQRGGKERGGPWARKIGGVA